MTGLEDLQGKVAVVTGGYGIIGQALATGMARAGIRVAIAGRKIETAREAANQIAAQTGGTLMAVTADVLDRNSLEAAKHAVNAAWGPIDFLVNCAGGAKPGAITAVEQMSSGDDLAKTVFGLDVDAFDEVFDLNFKGTLLPSLVFCTDMPGRGGVVINISSMGAYQPLTKSPAYSAAKSSVNSFTMWLAVHLAKMDVRVNAVAPGFFLTEQNRFLMVDQQTGEPTARARKVIAATPMGRFGQAEEPQATVLYLLSALARFVTGVVIPVDGGFNAYGGV